MTQRMANPSLVVPGALQPLLDLTEVIGKVGVEQTTLDLIRLRVSQINGRTYTFPDGPEQQRATDARLPKVAAWRTETCFDDAERSALEMAEAVTLMTDPRPWRPTRSGRSPPATTPTSSSAPCSCTSAWSTSGTG